MQTRRWVNQSQPQTLVIATFLLYAGVVFVLLGSNNAVGLGVAIVGDAFKNANAARQIENFGRLFIAVGGAGAGYLIANEKKVGYLLGLVVAALPLVTKLLIMVRFHVGLFDFDLVNVLFEVALVALIVHPQSRSYVRLWFK